MSGAITGGKYKNATANLLERKQEIYRLDEQIKQLRKESAEVAERLEELQDIVSEMGDVIEDTQRDYHQAELQATPGV